MPNTSKRQNIRKGLIIGSFLLFPLIIFYFSPYIIVMGAIKGIVVSSFVMFTLLFIFSIFFGRAACGYSCPMGGLQECLVLSNNRKVKGGKFNLIKYCIWLLWIITIAILFVRAGGIKEFDFFFEAAYYPHSINTYMIYYGVILGVVILALTAGRRAFCHYACWIAPFMVTGTKIAKFLRIPALHLKADKQKCIACDKCSKKCPMSLEVMNMIKNDCMTDSECILCGECVDVCPKKAIFYSFKRKK